MKVKTFILAFSICSLLFGVAYLNYNPLARKSIDEDKSFKIVQSNMWIDLNEEQMFGYADIIALGAVKNISDPQKTEIDDQHIIYTDYIFAVNEAFKGVEPGTEITIRIPGGKIGKTEFESDAASPEIGIEQILFLKKYELGKGDAYSILCGPLGKYTLNNDNIENNIRNNIENISTYKERLYELKNKIGNNIILPEGFTQ